MMRTSWRTRTRSTIGSCRHGRVPDQLSGRRGNRLSARSPLWLAIGSMTTLLATLLPLAVTSPASAASNGSGDGDSTPTATCADSVPPIGETLDTNLDRSGTRSLQVGSTYYAMPGSNSYLLVLSRDCLTKETFDQLPLDSSLDTKLAADLKPYEAANANYLAVLTGPAGAGNTSGVLPHTKPFSLVFPVVSGLGDIRDIGHNDYSGVENLGLQLNGSGAHSAPGELYGQLERPGLGHPFSFVQTDSVPFDTQSGLTTRVAPVPTAPRSGYSYLLISGLGTALDVKGASKDQGQPVVANGRTGVDSQRWELVADPSNPGTFEVVSANSGQCLNVLNASTEPGDTVAQWPCVDPAGAALNQLWRPVDRGDGTYALLSLSSDLVLAVAANNATAGTPVVQDTYTDGAKGEAWSLEPAPAVTAEAPETHGIYVLASQGGGVLGIPGGSTLSGTVAKAEDETDLTSQRWALEPAGSPNYVRIVNLNSQMCLQLTTLPGEPIVQAACSTSDTELWRADQNADGTYSIHLTNGSEAFTIDPDTGEAVMAANTNAPNQQWVFDPMTANPRDYGVYALSSPLGVAVGPGASAAGSALVAEVETEVDSQQWVLEPSFDDARPGTFRVVNVRTGLCVEPPGGDETEGEALTEQPCNYDAGAQEWHPVRQGDGAYALHSALRATLVMSLKGGSAEPGTPIAQAPDQGSQSQHWFLRPLARTLTMTVGTTDLAGQASPSSQSTRASSSSAPRASPCSIPTRRSPPRTRTNSSSWATTSATTASRPAPPCCSRAWARPTPPATSGPRRPTA
jgi:hypothetical protein